MGEKILKRGRKGGITFPRHGLDEFVTEYVDKLCSKTHTKPIDLNQLNVGVFGFRANSQEGRVKKSSMTQYGLIEGAYSKMNATKLCKDINLTSGDEQKKYLQNAFLNVAVFKKTFETFQNSTEDKSKIIQFAVEPLGVHPDNAKNFTDSFISSAKFVGLCTEAGDKISFSSSEDIVAEVEGEKSEEDDMSEEDKNEGDSVIPPKGSDVSRYTPNLQIKIDPTLDPEKLERQLKILRRYGLI